MNFNITAGTIARTAVLLLALTNQMLSAMGKEPSAHREHHCGAAGDGWHHDHCGTDRMVEEQLLYEGSHCGRQGVRRPEGKEREVKMIFWAGQERKT